MRRRWDGPMEIRGVARVVIGRRVVRAKPTSLVDNVDVSFVMDALAIVVVAHGRAVADVYL